MPDFSPSATHKFWNEYNDRTIYRVVSFMEGVEDWARDGDPQVEAALAALGAQLDLLGNQDLNEEDRMIQIAANLKTGRALRLLQALDAANPGAASKLLIHAEEVSQSEADLHGFFLKRNIVFERLRLLSRVFSSERFALVLRALEGDEG